MLAQVCLRVQLCKHPGLAEVEGSAGHLKHLCKQCGRPRGPGLGWGPGAGGYGPGAGVGAGGRGPKGNPSASFGL